MMRKGFVDSRSDDLDDLKMQSVSLLLAITEGQVEEGIYYQVALSMDDFSIVMGRMKIVFKQYLSEELLLDYDSFDWNYDSVLDLKK